MEAILPKLETLRQADSVTTLKELNRGEINDKAREYIRRQESLYFSELLEGQSRSENDFELVDGRMVCLDADGFEVDWQEQHENGVKYAKQRAAADKRLIPYIDIAEAEKAEAERQHYLIAQKQPRTLLSYSLCGDDLFDDETLISLGRVPGKKRGFVRVSVFDGQGRMRVLSRSVDGLTAHEVARQHQEWGEYVDPISSTAELLKKPIEFNYADYGLADKLAPKQGIDTFKFVQNQTDLINAHLTGLEEIAGRYMDIWQSASLSEQLRYDILSSLKQRLEGRWHNYGSLASSIATAGNSERAAGTEYYGCDTTLSSRSLANKLGYFGKEEKIDCVECPVCSKTVNLPKDLHQQKILHCVECGSTYSKELKRYLNKQEVKVVLNKRRTGRPEVPPTAGESLGQWFNRLGQEVKLRNRQKRIQD